jgi:hypothetical protein
VGATASLSTELLSLQKRIARSIVIAPAMSKKALGLNKDSVDASLKAAFDDLMKAISHLEPARLSVWSYEPLNQYQLDLLWSIFGKSAWVEFVPTAFQDKNSQTRMYIEDRIRGILPSLHEVSVAVFSKRRSSPFSLPLENYSSTITENLKKIWYRELSVEELKKIVVKLQQQYANKRRDGGGYEDDRHLLFSPAVNGECHGKSHPNYSSPQSFLAGRFRFGVALYAGFHYDVQSTKTSTLNLTLVNCDGSTRKMGPENRKHINIFPNDHLLPARSSK